MLDWYWYLKLPTDIKTNLPYVVEVAIFILLFWETIVKISHFKSFTKTNNKYYLPFIFKNICEFQFWYIFEIFYLSKGKSGAIVVWEYWK